MVLRSGTIFPLHGHRSDTEAAIRKGIAVGSGQGKPMGSKPCCRRIA
jgi:hypothetical protein